MIDIVISEFINASALASLQREFDVHYDETLVDRRDELIERASGARALVVRNRSKVDAALLAACPDLLAVGRLGVGLDNIDMEACRARGVPVFPATGANVVSVAEYVIAGALVMLRGAYQASDAVLAGQWSRQRYTGLEAAEKTIGIIGFGAIGRAVADRARALGMEVIACDPFVPADDPAWQRHGAGQRDLEALLAEGDAITVHVPLTETTRHLVDARAIAGMKRGAIVINSARGGVVDEHALAAGLRDGKLGAAMLDVFESEPLPAGSHLVGVPRLYLTPHIAGLTVEANERVGTMVAARVAEVLRRAP